MRAQSCMTVASFYGSGTDCDQVAWERRTEWPRKKHAWYQHRLNSRRLACNNSSNAAWMAKQHDRDEIQNFPEYKPVLNKHRFLLHASSKHATNKHQVLNICQGLSNELVVYVSDYGTLPCGQHFESWMLRLHSIIISFPNTGEAPDAWILWCDSHLTLSVMYQYIRHMPKSPRQAIRENQAHKISEYRTLETPDSWQLFLCNVWK